MYDAFISYSRQDLAAVTQLKQACDSLRLKVFFDSASLRAAETWPDQLGAGIEKARLFVLCWSASASSSDWVRAELKQAEMAKKPILPWTIDNTPLPAHLSTIQAVSSSSGAATEIANRRSRYRLKATAATLILGPTVWLAADRLTPKTTTFQGRIFDNQNIGIPGVTIQAAGQHTFTQPDGQFTLTLPIPPNTHNPLNVTLSKPGYQSQTIPTQTDAVPFTHSLEKAN
jgi:hypothetical protein